jgi:opacity protein-like surface antigen
MKKLLILSASVASMSASMAAAGGMEVGRFSPAFMFESGNFAELSSTRTTPKVTDDTFAPKKSMLAEMTNTSMSLKMAMNDRLSIGLQHYDAAKIDLSYVGAGGPFSSTPDPIAVVGGLMSAYLGGLGKTLSTASPAELAAASEFATNTQTAAAGGDPTAIGTVAAVSAGVAAAGKFAPEPFVDLSFKSTVLVANYKLSEGLDVFGGVKFSAGSAAGNVLANPHGDLNASEGTATSPVIGVSYSIPDIALRVSATYQGKAETSHKTTRTYNGVTETLKPTTAALPESLTLDFQTGVAKDTLVFGSIHRARWGGAHIFFDGAAEPKTTWTDSTTYSLGVGRKIDENWAVSASFNYEEGTESAGTSLLSTTNGVRGVTLGARYTTGNITVSLGANYSEFGDKTVTASPLGVGKFSNNSMTSVGLKLGFSF